MNKLFEFDGTNIEINPILLSIPEFSKLWKRDKTKHKEKARKELIYIYGMLSNEDDNIWKDFINLNEREKVIIEDLFGENSDWVPDRVVQNAMEKYKQRYPKDPAETLLETLKLTMIKIKDHLDNINLDERDNQGRLVYNPKNILDVSKQAIKVYMEIEEVIEKIKANKKIKEDKIRGGGTEGIFENPDMFTEFK